MLVAQQPMSHFLEVIMGRYDRCLKLTRYYYTMAERPTLVIVKELEEADQLLDQVLTHTITSYQRDALLCLLSDSMWGYSYTGQPFQKSFLLSVLNKGMFQVAAAEMQNFCMVDGRVDMRVISKRRCEQSLFITGRLLFA